MRPHPVPPKRTHLKHPRSSATNGSSTQLWLRRFWIALALISVLGISLVTYGKYSVDRDEDEDAYFNVQTATIAGDAVNVRCKLSLLIDQDQEPGLKKHQQELDAVVRSVLSDAYQGSVRPSISDVRAQMLVALNKKLPRKLQIREVYVQELLVGNS
jgi:hypothetical protein